MFTQWKFLGMAASVAMVGVIGFWLGHRVATGAAAERELLVARAYADNQNVAIEATRRELEAQSRRAVRQARTEALSEARRLKESNDYEQVITRVARIECERDPVAHGLLLDAIDRANAAIVSHTAGVPEDVRSDAQTGGAK